MNNTFKNIRYSLFFALSGALFFNPMKESATAVKSFGRTFGQALITGYDASRVTSNFVRWMLLFALLFVGFTFLCNWVLDKKYTEGQQVALGFLNQFMVLADTVLVLKAFEFFFKEANHDNSITLVFAYICGVIVYTGVYIVFKLDKKIKFEKYQLGMLVGLGLAYPVIALLKIGANSGKTLVIAQLVIVSVCALAFLIAGHKKIFSDDKLILCVTTFSAAMPLILSWYIETAYVRVGKEIAVGHIRRDYIILLIVLVILCCGYYFFSKRNEVRISVSSLVYPVLLYGITSTAYQAPLTRTVALDMMEDANAGILISDFLNFGKLPIIEHYGGHMMTLVWEGIWYGLINGEKGWSVYGAYNALLTPLIVLCFSFVIKHVWNEEMAFWSCLFIGFSTYWNYWGMGALCIFAILGYVKKPGNLRACLIWLACIWVTLYRLDMGFSFDVAVVVTLAIYAFSQKNKAMGKQLTITFGAVIGSFLVLCLIACLVKGINPISRIMEFIKISASNLYWSYTGIGDPSKLIYAITYLVLPFAMIVMYMVVAISKSFREKAGSVRWIILLVLGAAFFANFQRGLIRHSLVLGNNMSYFIWWTAPLFIAIFVSCYWKKEYVIPVYMAFFLFGCTFEEGGTYNYVAMADTSAAVIEDNLSHWDEPGYFSQQVSRINMIENHYDKVWPLQRMVDALLTEDETFVDFVNCTVLYSLLGRECPVYVSQSPIQLAGEYTQECFIEQISANPQHNPIVVMPNFTSGNNHHMFHTDGVANNYRNYLVAEYIYQNYRPLCWDDDYAIWCLNDRYEAMVPKAEAAGEELIEYGFDRAAELSGKNELLMDDNDHHIYKLDKLPMYWGEMDQQQSYNNQVLAQASVSDGVIVWDAVSDKTIGNYLKSTVTLDGDQEAPAIIRMGTYDSGQFTEYYRYEINLVPGTHTYMFRVSNDYFWYANDLNAAIIEGEGVVDNTQILIGD